MAGNDTHLLDQVRQRTQHNGILEVPRRDPETEEAGEVSRVVDPGDDLFLEGRVPLFCAIVDDNRFHGIIAVSGEVVRPEFVLPQRSPAFGCANVENIAPGRFANVCYCSIVS